MDSCFIPCLNLRKIYGNASNPLLRNFYYIKKKIYESLEKSLAIFRKFWKTSETVQKCFLMFLRFLKILGISSKIFGTVRKSSENFGSSSKVIFQMFLKFFKIFGKSSEIFGSVRKSSEIFGKFRKRFKSNFQMFL